MGDVVEYRVQRPGQALDVELTVGVTLVRYPVAAAVRGNPAAVALALVLLVAGSLVLLAASGRPRRAGLPGRDRPRALRPHGVPLGAGAGRPGRRARRVAALGR